MRTRKQENRSPLKDKPLRLPGQSLQEERDALWDDKLGPYFLMALFFVVLAGLEWCRDLMNLPPMPGLYTIAASMFLSLAAWRIFRALPKLRALRQGIAGEQAVGQFLERLHADGYRVFHDVVGPTFNVDHVLVGPAGIFTIETKTWSKPMRGDARVTADADGLLIAGQRPDRDPIVQARAQAGWIAQQIKESTGRTFTVRPVIVFPGWFIDPSAQGLPKLWVLEPKALPTFLRNEPRKMESSDVALASYHLSRMIRAGTRS